MKRAIAVLAMVKNEGIFMPFWLRHYGQWFAPSDMYIHSDASVDDTCDQVRRVRANLIEVPPETIQIGRNDRYIKNVISELLSRYECVLFAESPDDIIVPGPTHGHDLWQYVDEFLTSNDRFRYLSGINIIQTRDEPDWDGTGKLLATRNTAIRCPQYDNPFLWKDEPTWGRGWHDIGGERLEGMGDVQGEDKRLYNVHIHYADFRLCNRRHHVRQATFNLQQRAAYASKVDFELQDQLLDMVERPGYWFSNGKRIPVEPWMRQLV